MAQEKSEQARIRNRAILYSGILIILVAAALGSFLIAPHGQGIDACNGLFFQNDRYACITNFAISSLNASACGKLAGGYADNCYASIANKMGNATICGRIPDQNESYACSSVLAIAGNDTGVCYSLKEPYRSDCFKGIALRTNNETMCSEVSDVNTGTLCVSLISLREMYILRSPKYCANVTSANDKNLTEYIISNFSYGTNSSILSGNGALNAVALFPNVTFTARDFCYTISAGELSNSSICSNIYDTAAKGICEMETGGAVSNSSAPFNYSLLAQSCKNIGGYSALCNEAATMAEAIQTRNATLCGTIDTALQVQCYTAIAVAAKNTSYCSHIANATAMSTCMSSA